MAVGRGSPWLGGPVASHGSQAIKPWTMVFFFFFMMQGYYCHFGFCISNMTHFLPDLTKTLTKGG
jgi:hypothetical protein